MHWSSYKTAKTIEELLNLEQYGIVERNIRLAEAAEAQSVSNSLQEQQIVADGTPSVTDGDDIGQL